MVADHYRAEAQTLATAATWNLAKLGEVTGIRQRDRTRTPRRTASPVAGGERRRDPLTAMATALRGIENYFAGDQPGEHSAR